MTEALRWLSLLPLLKTLHYFAADSLTGAGFQGIRTTVQVGIAIFNVLFNLWIIPGLWLARRGLVEPCQRWVAGRDFVVDCNPSVNEGTRGQYQEPAAAAVEVGSVLELNLRLVRLIHRLS